MDLPTEKMIGKKIGGVGHAFLINRKSGMRHLLKCGKRLKLFWTISLLIQISGVSYCRGAGDKSFVAGADISQFEKSRSDANAAAEYEEFQPKESRRLMISQAYHR